MSTLLLIDGSNYLFRAYHGLPPLSTSNGEPTGAMRGFLGMLGRVQGMVKPDRAVVVFDAPGKNFRHAMYPEYKANRPPMPDDLRVQIEPLQKVLPDLGWPLLVVPGVEADDVIATLARKGRAEGMKIVIATGDKDMAQLVDENVTLLNTMNTKFYDRDGVIEKYGVPPERIIDYLALMGDKVDNVPGIEKCGEKTAAKWIAQFGSLDEIKRRADEVKGKIGENLRKGLPFLDEARKLVTIKDDCELPVSGLEALDFRTPSAEALRAFARRWEMSNETILRALPPGMRARVKTALEAAHETPHEAPNTTGTTGSLFDLGELDAMPAPVPVPGDTPRNLAVEPDSTPQAVEIGTAERVARLQGAIGASEAGDAPDELPFTRIEDPLQLADFAARLADVSARCDFPTGISLHFEGDCRRARLAGVAFALSPKDVTVVLASESLPAEAIAAGLSGWLAGDAPKVFHDAKTMLHVLAAAGAPVEGRVDDTMLMDYVVEAHVKHDLPKLAARYLARTIPEREAVFGKGAKRKAWTEVPREEVEKLLAEEAASVRAISSVLGSVLRADEVLWPIYDEIERPLLKVLFRMENTGVAVDGFLLARESEELGVRIDALEAEAERVAGTAFNLSSPKQLGKILFEDLKLPVLKKTPSGTPSTDEDVLTELALDYPLPKIVLEHRRLTKLRSTYLEKLPRMADPVDGRVHTTFGQATAVTGRLASSDPNLQNIPVRTEEGRRVREAFVAERGSVIVSADYSQVELRIMAHLSKDRGLLDAFARGEDIHRSTAAEVFGRPIEAVTPDERRMAKVINFGLIYGMSAFGLAQNLGIDRRVAANYIDAYFTRYPGVKRYMDEMRALAHEQGFVETVFGRRLWIPDIKSGRKPVQAAAERAAINAPMQGTAADVIKKAMIAVDAWLRERKLGARLVLQVHDELILEVPEAEVELVKAEVPKLMREAAELEVPLIAEVGSGDSWEAAH